MPMGRSFWGLRASSEVVATMSKPIEAKKTSAAAAVKMPVTPYMVSIPKRLGRRYTWSSSPRLRRRDKGREVRRLYEEYPEPFGEQRYEDLDRCDHCVELRAQPYPHDQNGRHEGYHDQHYPVVRAA